MGKLGPLGEPGYANAPDNETSRYRGKKGRSEMEVLGLVSYCTSPERTGSGESLTSLKWIVENLFIPDETTIVANKEDPSRTETAEETG